MSTDLTWMDIFVRLILAVIAGGLIGLDRGEHGRPAGLRTTILVCLAAAVSMIQVNLMLTMAGRHTDSYVMLDLMRLPLGILSGMGFIGAGAILKQGTTTFGVTTAATLWFVTVMGLCLGAGQISLGLVMLALGFTTLSVLRRVEDAIKQDRRASITVVLLPDGPTEQQIRDDFVSASLTILSFGITHTSSGNRLIRSNVLWRAKRTDTEIPDIVSVLAKSRGVSRIRWQP